MVVFYAENGMSNSGYREVILKRYAKGFTKGSLGRIRRV
jgi:hypothetical protein